MARRCSYLPLLVTEIQKHYNIVIAKGGINGNCTFYYDNKLLSSHYPMGLLYDLYNFDNSPLWIISVKFDNANNFTMSSSIVNEKVGNNSVSNPNTSPSSNTNATISSSLSGSQNLLGCITSTSMIESAYFNTIKQADYQRYGSAKRIHNMSPKDQISLWESIWTGNYQLFWNINSKVIDQNKDEKEKLPLRVYITNDPREMEKIKSMKTNKNQGESIEKQEQGNEKQDESISFQVLQWPWEYKMASIKDLKLEIEREAQSRGMKIIIKQIITHGIILPMDIKIVEIVDKLLYPDNFLHFIIK